MSYQIKSTPFFRRMVSTSKKNGQLQKLKEEYERIKEFNDRTIEMKMRQVRLKRLFREIEEIKESSSSLQTKRRRVMQEKNKTSEEIRLEQFVKSRELGKTFSKMNARAVERYPGRIDPLSSSNSEDINSEKHRKERSEKRIQYGNTTSASNKKKSQNTRKKAMQDSSMLPVAIEKENIKRELLEKRIKYGNSCSSSNLRKIPKKNLQHKYASQQQIGRTSSSSSPSPPHSQAIAPPPTESTQATTMDMPDEDDVFSNSLADSQIYKAIHEMQNNQIKYRTFHSDELQQLRAKERWNKVKMLVSNGLDTSKSQTLSEDGYDVVESREFELRSISNGTHLPQTDIYECGNISYSEGNDELSEEEVEVVLNIEELQDKAGACFLRTSELALRSEEHDHQPEKKVHKFVRMIEPLAKSVANDEIYEFGVQKLRSIFEHNY